MRKTVGLMTVLGLAVLCSSAALTVAEVRTEKADKAPAVTPAASSQADSVAAREAVTVQDTKRATSSGMRPNAVRRVSRHMGGFESSEARDGRGVGDLCDTVGLSCQLPGSGPSGFSITTSDAAQSVSQGDNFRTAPTGDLEVTSFCWWGIYFDGDSTGDVTCDPVVPDDFTVEIWSESGGLPDTVVTSWNEGTDLTVNKVVAETLTFSGGTRWTDLWEYTGTIPAGFTLDADTCYFIVVYNDTSPPSDPVPDCYWWWRMSTGADDWSPGVESDLAWCMDIDTVNPSDCQPVPPCDLPGAGCQLDTGNWILRACDDLTIVDDFIADADGNITSLCWWGVYWGTAGVGEAYADDFTISFMTDGDSDGFPDTTIDTFVQADLDPTIVRVQTGLFNDDPIYEYAADLPAGREIAVTTGDCLWISFHNICGADTNWTVHSSASGTSYLLQGEAPWDGGDFVTGVDGNSAAFCVDVAIGDSTPCISVVPNDECDGAILMECPTDTETIDNTLATRAFPPYPDDPQLGNQCATCCVDTFPLNVIGEEEVVERTVWYKFVATGDYVTIRTCGSTALNTVAGLYDDCGVLFETGDASPWSSGHRECGAGLLHAQFCAGPLITDKTYYIMVGNYYETTPGVIEVQLDCTASCDDPPLPVGACCHPDTSCTDDRTAQNCLCDPIPPEPFGTAWFEGDLCADIECPAGWCTDGAPEHCTLYSSATAGYSDWDHSYIRFDDFYPADPDLTGGPYYIAGLCWDGIWLTDGCPVPLLNFEVQFFAEDPATRLPDFGASLGFFSTADGTLSVGGIDTGVPFAPPQTTNIWQMTAGLNVDPAELPEVYPETCYWVMVAGEADDGCIFLWDSSSSAFGGNDRSGIYFIDTETLQADTDSDADFVYCLDIEITPGQCPPPEGACCLQDAPSQCIIVTGGADVCTGLGGVYIGDDTVCTPDPCATGACCADQDTCTDTTADDCVGGGPGMCDFATWGNPPQCFADTNGDNKTDTNDYGLIQAAFGYTDDESLCRYDVNCDGAINTIDLGLCEAAYTDPCGAAIPHYLDPDCAYYGGGAGGTFHGYGTYCAAPRLLATSCDCTCPAGAMYECSTACGLDDPDCNGGCNPDPPVLQFDPIYCGATVDLIEEDPGAPGVMDTVCGTVTIQQDPGGEPGDRLRDMDWYKFEITAQTYVTWTVYSDFGASLFLIGPNTVAECDYSVAWGISGGGGDCGMTTMSLCLEAGFWYAVVAPDFSAHQWLPCSGESNNYYGELTCGPCPTGACCEVGVCTATTTEPDCAGQWFEGETCPEFDCPSSWCGDWEYCQAFAGETASYSDADEYMEGMTQLMFDDFTPEEDGDITALCWEGIWLTEGCTYPNTNFRVAFFPDDGAGLPNLAAPIATYFAGSSMTVTATDTGDPFAPPDTTNIYLFEATLDAGAVTVTTGTTYWLEVSGGVDDCLFLWNLSSSAFGGNDYDATGPADYSTVKSGTDDLTFCFNVKINPPLPTWFTCPEAEVITCGESISFDSALDPAGGTMDPDDPYASCNYNGPTADVYRTVWFQFTWDDTVGTTATLSTCNTDDTVMADNLMAVYTGACGSATLVEQFCAEDVCGPTHGWLSEINMTGLVDGTTYYVMIGHAFGDNGPQILDFTCP
jgi:hypothetical protein